MNIEQAAKECKNNSWQLANLSNDKKNQLLNFIADGLLNQSDAIIAANEQDVVLAKQQQLAPSLLARLIITPQQLQELSDTVRATANLKDPCNQLLEKKLLPSGLQLQRVTVPLGVVAVIYESRPNVTIDVATLCLKSGNAVILRGGKEAINTNRKLVGIIEQALLYFNLPKELVQFIDSNERNLVSELLQLNMYIDLLIPRGGAALQRLCIEQSTIAVISGGIGVCHIFVDDSADFTKSIEIIDNAKTQRPSVCNAVETILVHNAIAKEFIPLLAQKLVQKQVTLHVEPQVIELLKDTDIEFEALAEENLNQEWLSLDLNLCLVADIDQAIAHIRQHGTSHSEVILTESPLNSQRFVQLVDAAAVYVNASSRFTDGGQFGLGSEVAVSTQKMHARGPMGLEALVTYKWIGRGDYLIRS